MDKLHSLTLIIDNLLSKGFCLGYRGIFLPEEEYRVCVEKEDASFDTEYERIIADIMHYGDYYGFAVKEIEHIVKKGSTIIFGTVKESVLGVIDKLDIGLLNDLKNNCRIYYEDDFWLVFHSYEKLH